MRYLIVLLIVFLSACSAQVKNIDTVKNVQEIQKPKVETKVDHFYKLGEFYRSIYLSELLFDAMVDIEKIRHSIKLRRRLYDKDIVSDCHRRIRIEADSEDAERVLKFKAADFQCKIHDLSAFYREILNDDFLTYFKLKKKTGSYWLYMDLTPLATWERYFWYAYFIEKGFEPEFSERLKIFVLGHFNSVQDALQIKAMYPEANLKVKYAIYREALEDSGKEVKIVQDGLDLEKVDE